MAGLNFGNTYTMRGKKRPSTSGPKVQMRPVKAVDATTGETVGEYDSVQDAADKLGVPKQSIVNCCRSNRGMAEPQVHPKNNTILSYNDKPAF